MLSENEKELLRLIRENDNPEQALVVALGIISDFLVQYGPSGSQAAACLPEPV